MGLTADVSGTVFVPRPGEQTCARGNVLAAARLPEYCTQCWDTDRPLGRIGHCRPVSVLVLYVTCGAICLFLMEWCFITTCACFSAEVALTQDEPGCCFAARDSYTLYHAVGIVVAAAHQQRRVHWQYLQCSPQFMWRGVMALRVQASLSLVGSCALSASGQWLCCRH